MVLPVSRPTHVLVVEAQASKSEPYYASLHGNLGNQVVQAASPDAALDLAAACPALEVGVIHMDPALPACLELVCGLRALHPDVALILIAENMDAESMVRAMEVAVDEFVLEPTSPAYVNEVVREMITGRKYLWSP